MPFNNHLIIADLNTIPFILSQTLKAAFIKKHDKRKKFLFPIFQNSGGILILEFKLPQNTFYYPNKKPFIAREKID